jgi:putative Holliday junction resolvase
VSILASPFDLPAGRLLALDLGQARTGVAVCDELGLLATPLTTLRRQPTRAADYAALAALAQRERAVGILVGLPAETLADSGAQARWVRRYTGRLAAALSLPIAFWDETLSTVDAAQLRSEGQGRASLDAIAAAVILEQLLAARRRAHSDAGAIANKVGNCSTLFSADPGG